MTSSPTVAAEDGPSQDGVHSSDVPQRAVFMIALPPEERRRLGDEAHVEQIIGHDSPAAWRSSVARLW
jgi:hypothetical protein